MIRLSAALFSFFRRQLFVFRQPAEFVFKFFLVYIFLSQRIGKIGVEDGGHQVSYGVVLLVGDDMSHIIFFDPEEIKRNGCRFIEFLSDFFHEIHEWTRTGIHFLDRNCDFLSACSFPGEHAVADGFHFTEVEPDFNRNADDCGIAVFKRILDLECAAHIIAELIGPPDKTVRHLAYLCIFLFCQLDFLCIVLEYSEHSGFIVLSSELYDTALCHEPQPCIFIFEGGDFLLYLLPFLIGIAVFTLYPVINVVLMSFKEGYSYLSRSFDQWGLANYQTVLSDPKFAQAISNTLKYVILVVPISTCIAVVIAYLLNQKLRFSALFQTAYFLPMVTSITAVGLAWKLMYNKNFGIINYLLSFFGVDPIPWLEKAACSIPALVIFGIWNILPFTIILLLSGLQNIDPQYYTAARVDGSKSLRIFFRITVPLLAPTIFLVCIVNTISCFKVFSELYPLFNGKPGPFNNLYTVVYYIRYAMMENRKYGIAAAAALVLFLFIFVFTMVQLLLQKKTKRR